MMNDMTEHAPPRVGHADRTSCPGIEESQPKRPSSKPVSSPTALDDNSVFSSSSPTISTSMEVEGQPRIARAAIPIPASPTCPPSIPSDLESAQQESACPRPTTAPSQSSHESNEFHSCSPTESEGHRLDNETDTQSPPGPPGLEPPSTPRAMPSSRAITRPKSPTSHSRSFPAPSLISVPQAAVQLQLPISEIIARFKPSSRDIISGIAPHVFDERRRRRGYRTTNKSGYRRSALLSEASMYGYNVGVGCSVGSKSPVAARSTSSYPRWLYHHSSPLRRSIVVSWDDNAMYLDETTAYKLGSTTHRICIALNSDDSDSLTTSSASSSSESLPCKDWGPVKISTLTPEVKTKGTKSWTKGRLFKALVSRIKKRDPRTALSPPSHDLARIPCRAT